MIYCNRFSYTPAVSNAEVADPTADSARKNETLVGFIHMEAGDEDNTGAVETKLVKNLKWAARKNETQSIVLHSFAHLSDSKADPAAIKALLDRAEERLQTSGYETHQTPFGYFLNLDVQAPGHSFARLYKEF
jgi:hypothetical protein